MGNHTAKSEQRTSKLSNLIPHKKVSISNPFLTPVKTQVQFDISNVPQIDVEEHFSLYQLSNSDEWHQKLDNMKNNQQSVLMVLNKKMTDYQISKVSLEKNLEATLNTTEIANKQSNMEISMIQKISEDIQLKKVYLSKIQQSVWVKIFQKNEKNQQKFANEIQALLNLSHTNIPNVKDYFQDAKAYYIIYNQFIGLPLHKYVSKKMMGMDDIQLQSIFKQLLTTIRYINFKNFVHGNLEPNNIFYNGERIFIMGWECVGNLALQDKFTDTDLKPCFICPELRRKKFYQKQADVYSIGLIFLLFVQSRQFSLPKKLLKQKKQIEKELGVELDQMRNITIFNLIIYQEYTLSLLSEKPLNRPDLVHLQDDPISQINLKNENPEDFILTSEVIYHYSTRNTKFDPFKKYYCRYIMSQEERTQFIKMMSVIDIDQNGFLNYKNFVKGVQRASPDITPQRAKEMYQEIDDDGNGYIEFDEFIVTFMEDSKLISRKMMLPIFNNLIEDQMYNQSISPEKTSYILLERLREELEMDDQEYDDFFRYFYDKQMTKIYYDNFSDFLRTQFLLGQNKGRIRVRASI